LWNGGNSKNWGLTYKQKTDLKWTGEKTRSIPLGEKNDLERNYNKGEENFTHGEGPLVFFGTRGV